MNKEYTFACTNECCTNYHSVDRLVRAIDQAEEVADDYVYLTGTLKELLNKADALEARNSHWSRRVARDLRAVVLAVET